MSEPQSPQPRRRSSSSPGPAAGRGPSAGARRPPPWNMTALIIGSPRTAGPQPREIRMAARPSRDPAQQTAHPAAQRDGRLAPRGQRNALVEDTEAPRLDLLEQREVDAPHDPRRHERARVGRGKRRPRPGVVLARARGLGGHEAYEGLAVAADLEILRAHPGGPEVLLRDVDPAAAGIGADVADDVGELQRHAEAHRVLVRARVGVAEDLDAAQAHGRGHAVAVRRQVLERLVRRALQVHLAALDDRLEGRARQAELPHGGGELPRDRVLGRAVGLVAARDVAAPGGQPGALRAGVGAEVGDVVHGAAERVDRVERLATGARQREKRVVEVRAALARDPRGQPDQAHRAATCAPAATRAYPWAANQRTASCNASRGSVCGSPSSRTAFVGEKYMRLRAMRTAVRGTAGGRPVSSVANMRPRMKSTIIWPVGVGFTSQGPMGADGLTMTTGSPRAARSIATRSARNFEAL